MGFRTRIKKIVFGHTKPIKKVGEVGPAILSPPSPPKRVIKQSVVDGKHPVLALYGRDSCPYSNLVQQKIEELDIGPYIEFRDASFRSPWRDDLLQKTGLTQVPCLFIDGESLFESRDIIAWFEDNLFE